MRRTGAAGVLAALLLVLVACTSARPSTPAGNPTVASNTTTPPRKAPAPVLHVVAWGGVDGLLSVLVKNVSRSEVRSARAVITATDAAGAAIATTSAPASARCCTVLALPPGQQFGLYADIGPAADRAASVTVAYTGMVLAPWQPTTYGTLTVKHEALTTRGGPAVVSATFTEHGKAGPYVAGQAFLSDRSGHLIAVVSGRFFCLRPGQPRQVHIQLFHPVPAGTRVHAVVGYPFPAGTSGASLGLPACHG